MKHLVKAFFYAVWHFNFGALCVVVWVIFITIILGMIIFGGIK